MLKLSQRATRTLLAVHGWSGMLLGMLLYAVICTGVAAVFASEINNWASPLNRGDVAELPADLDGVIRQLAPQVDPEFHEDIAAYRSAGGRLLVFFHKHDLGPDGRPSERGVEFEINPETNRVLARRTGWFDEIAAERRPAGVADFLVNLHVRLHIPDPYGLIVTGVLGMVMMIAAITGLFIHRHLLKELFTLRLGGEPVLRSRDLHAVAGSWNLPFAFVLAFTGSFLSFATTVGLPLVAKATFGGDEDALIDTLYGTPHAEDPAPVRLSDLNVIVADAAQRSGVAPDFLSVERYGRADARVYVFTPLPENTLVYSSNLYDGASGAHLAERPPLGQSPSLGATLVGLMYPLHFGDFAGLASKAVWVGLGFAGAYVTLSGMLLWTRRRIEQRVWRGVARLVHWVGYGLPLALVCAPYAHFALRDSALPSGTLQGIAFLTVAAVVALASTWIADLERLRRTLVTALSLALIGLPVVRMATGGPDWLSAWQAELPGVVGGDLVLLVAGALALWLVRSRRRQGSADQSSADERIMVTRAEAQSA